MTHHISIVCGMHCQECRGVRNYTVKTTRAKENAATLEVSVCHSKNTMSLNDFIFINFFPYPKNYISPCIIALSVNLTRIRYY